MSTSKRDVIIAREKLNGGGTRIEIDGRVVIESESPSGPYWKDVVRALGYSIVTVWDDEVPLDIVGNEVTK